MSTKSSPLDFIPTSLLKSCRNIFAIIIARLANLTFEHRSFPSKFKLGIVTPLPKNRTSDCTEPSNYRPVTDLNTISKILERLVLDRLVSHVTSSPYFDPMQSAYRRFYYTERYLPGIRPPSVDSTGRSRSKHSLRLCRSQHIAHTATQHIRGN